MAGNNLYIQADGGAIWNLAGAGPFGLFIPFKTSLKVSASVVQAWTDNALYALD
jgi:hypothetical protein